MPDTAFCREDPPRTGAEEALRRTEENPSLVVEVPAPERPVGAKGVGEAPVVGVPGAVANAVAAATGGVRMRQLPMTPERVWRALSGRAQRTVQA